MFVCIYINLLAPISIGSRLSAKYTPAPQLMRDNFGNQGQLVS